MREIYGSMGILITLTSSGPLRRLFCVAMIEVAAALHENFEKKLSFRRRKLFCMKAASVIGSKNGNFNPS